MRAERKLERLVEWAGASGVSVVMDLNEQPKYRWKVTLYFHSHRNTQRWWEHQAIAHAHTLGEAVGKVEVEVREVLLRRAEIERQGGKGEGNG